MKHVPFGERWTCEGCGKTWNTAQIPAEQYFGLVNEQRRARLFVIGAALAVFAVFGLLAVVVAESLFVLAPVVVAGWLIAFMPFWHRRMRRRTRELPKWQLHPE